MQQDSNFDRKKRQEFIVPHYMRLVDHLLPEKPLDTCSLVLKGHLLVEQAVNELLAELLDIESLPDDKRLEFDQKMSLIRAYVCSRNLGPNADVLDSIKALNTLRNSIAHNLMERGDLNQRLRKVVVDHHKRHGKRRPTSPTPESGFSGLVRDVIAFLVELRCAVVGNRGRRAS